MSEQITINLNCTPEEARALQLGASRFGHKEAVELSENPEQAWRMKYGMYELSQQLEQQLTEHDQ